MTSLVQHGIVRWLVLTVAVWVAAQVMPGIRYDGVVSLAVAALALGILNSFVRPVLRLLSLPFIILSLGLFLLVINALLLRAVGWLVPGFHVDGFWPAVGGSLIVSLVSFCLGYPGRPRGGRFPRPPPSGGYRRGPPPGTGPIIDI
jgi:putative membrane protein